MKVIKVNLLCQMCCSIILVVYVYLYRHSVDHTSNYFRPISNSVNGKRNSIDKEQHILPHIPHKANNKLFSVSIHNRTANRLL